MGFNKVLFCVCTLLVIYSSHLSEARKKGHNPQHGHSHRDHPHQDKPRQALANEHNKVPGKVPTPDHPNQDKPQQEMTNEHNKVPVQVPAPNNPHQDFIDEHNKARAEVGVGSITWNDTVAVYAQKYAESKIETCEMVHSEGPYGENLAEGYGEMTGAQAVKFWVTEKANYDYASNKCVNDECGHYTQVVWRNSIHLGCASVKCKNGWVFVICSYDPPGNYQDEGPY